MIGLNGPADMRLDPRFFDLLKARWIRVVLKPEYDLNPWIDACHHKGMSVLGVIARESLLGSYDNTADYYAERYGTLDAIQAGNEADHHSDSSWSMEPSDLSSLIVAVRAHFHQSVIIGPGLVSGDPHYLDAIPPAVLSMLDGIAVHPYGQRPDNAANWSELPGNFGTVGSLLDSYRYHGKPIWVTEVGVSTTQCSPAFQARYCEAILKTLNLRRDVPVTVWFCADDAMVPEFGLYDTNGSPKPAAPAFLSAAGGTAPVDQFKFVLGFKQMADANPGLVGRPLENEYGFVEGLSLQRTANGLLIWANVSGGHMGFIDYRNGDRYRWNPSAGLVKVTA